MSENYSIESKDGVTIVRFFKEPEVIDICDSIDDVAKNYPTALRLTDLSCGVNLSSDEIKLVGEYGKFKFSVPSKLAIVASDDFSFGLSLVFNFHRSDNFLVQRVFRSEEEAMLWLKK